MPWKPDRLLKAMLLFTWVTLIIVWLPLVRGLMDGDSYVWGNSFIGMQLGGRGLHGDYWLLVVQAAFGILLLYLGWRGARQPFHWLLLLWQIPLAAQACYNAFTSPEDYRFRGDTLGVDVSLAWVGPLFAGGFALLSILWVARDLQTRRNKTVPDWGRPNFIFLAIALVLLPVQFMLLRFGEPMSTNDQVGVLLTITQWVLIYLALVPWSTRSRVEPADEVVESV